MPDYRLAKAVVYNNSGRKIYGATLTHKYSTDYHQSLAILRLANGQTSDELEVEYNTGFGTTGKDWWLLTWWNEELDRFYGSTPNNFRGVVNFIDEILPSMVGAPFSLLIPPIAVANPLLGTGLWIALQFAKYELYTALDEGDTRGFKQHILTEGDSGKRVTITINADNTIVINSASGESHTVWSSMQPGHEATVAVDKVKAKMLKQREESGVDDDDVYEDPNDDPRNHLPERTQYIIQRPKHPTVTKPDI